MLGIDKTNCSSQAGGENTWLAFEGAKVLIITLLLIGLVSFETGLGGRIKKQRRYGVSHALWQSVSEECNTSKPSWQ